MRALMVRLSQRRYWHARSDQLLNLWPGAALCAVIALAAVFVSGMHGGPPMLYGLLFGAAFHYQSHDPRTAAGVDICMRVVLRVGIGLLGARITIGQVAGLGWITGLLVIMAVASTLLCSLLAARWLRLSWHMGLLVGGATAICGAAAVLAIAAVLPRNRESERNAITAVVLATVLSTAAMLLYPLVSRALSLPPSWAGVFIGATIHDVAQVVVAGYSLGQEAGDTASIVKLLRVSLLVVVVMVIATACRRVPALVATGQPAGHSNPLPVPGFLLLFVLLVGVHSAGWVSPVIQSGLAEGSSACLMVGATALGMKMSFGGLARTGWRPAALMLITTLWLTVLVLAVIELSIYF